MWVNTRQPQPTVMAPGVRSTNPATVLSVPVLARPVMMYLLVSATAAMEMEVSVADIGSWYT